MPDETRIIAPCGMNCALCMAFQRDKRHCPGCRGDDSRKSISCLKCIIKNCQSLKSNKSGFCHECAQYPCKRLKALDKRYRTKYSMSMIENLENIKTIGLAAFTRNEKKRWRCPDCGGVICVHRGCLRCKSAVIRPVTDTMKGKHAA